MLELLCIFFKTTSKDAEKHEYKNYINTPYIFISKK